MAVSALGALKMNSMTPRGAPVVWLAALVLVGSLHGQALAPGQTWHYRALETSTLTHECLICGLVTPPLPVRGGFDLVLLSQNPLTTTYGLENIALEASAGTGQSFSVSGNGTWELGGELAVRQTLTLHLILRSRTNSDTRTLTNISDQVTLPWPDLRVDLQDTAGQVWRYNLHLLAAPFRELWFSTGHGFTAGATPPPTNVMSPGDLLADNGRVVRRWADLAGPSGLAAASLALDAVDVAPGGTVLFSLCTDATNATGRVVAQGDVLAATGAVAQTNSVLLGAFGLMPMVADAGLDGVQVLDDGEVLFSITQDVFSERLGTTLGHGDLLSNRGTVVEPNSQLLARFNPPRPGHDYGLKAFHRWPSGEVWFATEEGFSDAILGPILDGDLLSDQGYVVAKNLELVRSFAPVEDVSNFGLTSLFVVTDVEATAPPPLLARPVLAAGGSALTLSWAGTGRVFEVQQAPALGSSFLPISPILPGATWTGPAAFQTNTLSVYRLRQW